MEKQTNERKGGVLSTKLKSNSKAILESIAIILVLLAIAFGVAKYVLNRTAGRNIGLSFYDYAIGQNEITTDPSLQTRTSSDRVFVSSSVKTAMDSVESGMLEIEYKIGDGNWLKYNDNAYEYGQEVGIEVTESCTFSTRLVLSSNSSEYIQGANNYVGPVTSIEIDNIGVCAITRDGQTTVYRTIDAAIATCDGDSQNPASTPTTIFMIADTVEPATVPQGKNIILDLQGHTVAGRSSGAITDMITLNVQGEATLIDTVGGGELAAGDMTAVYVESTGTFNLGVNEAGTPDVSTTTPRVTGVWYGVNNSSSGTFNFYDGVITGNYNAILGNVNDKPTNYVVKTSTSDGIETAILFKETTITFLSDSQIILQENRNQGEALGTLPTVTKKGYTFDGWFTAETGGTQISDQTIVPAVNTTYYAHWTANIYTVTFNETVSPQSKQVTFDGGYGALPTPTRQGYGFGGWYVNMVSAANFQDDTGLSESGDNIGKVITQTGSITSDFIEIPSGVTVYANRTVYGVFAYDQNYDFVGSAIYYGESGPTPANTKYVRLYIFKNGTMEQTINDLVISTIQNTNDVPYIYNEVTSTTVDKITQDHMLFAKWVEGPHAIITGVDDGVSTGLIRLYNGTYNVVNGHVGKPSAWKNLIGNQDAIIYNVNFNTANDTVAVFDGQTSYANMGQIDVTGTFSLQVDVKFNAVQSYQQNIISNAFGGGCSLLIDSDQKIKFRAYINGDFFYQDSGIIPDTSTVYNIAETFDGTTFRMYINGRLIREDAATGTISNPIDNTVMMLGVNPYASNPDGNYTGMNVYSARVYSKALTASEVVQNLDADRIRKQVGSANLGSANAASTTVKIVFTENVTGFTADDITVTNGTKGTLTGSGSVYYLTVTDIVAGANLTISIADNSYTSTNNVPGFGYTVTRTRDISNCVAIAKLAGGDLYCSTLEEAIAACPGTQLSPQATATEVQMIANTQESVTIPTGKNIVIDLDGNTINGNSSVNNGTTITNNGTLTITGDAGSITSSANAIENNGVLTLGEKDGNVSIIAPLIQGGHNGIVNNSNSTFNMYDGVVKGNADEHYKAVSGAPDDIETGYQLVTTTEEIDGVTYEVAMLSGGARFKSGRAVNAIMKRLAAGDITDTSIIYSTVDTSIVSVLRCTDSTMPTVNGTVVEVQTNDSILPIKMWCEDVVVDGVTKKSIKWWTEDPSPELNQGADGMFEDFQSVTRIDTGDFDTSNVGTMQGMFDGCKSLTNLDLSGFDTGKVYDFNAMFLDCNSLTSLDLSNFDTSNVRDMSTMFTYCRSLTNLDVSGFDTSKTTSFQGMFTECSSLTSLDVSNFDTSSATNLGGMFTFCSSLTNLDVSGFDTSNVTYIGGMFLRCSGLTSIDVSGFDTSKATNFSSMFLGCSSLTSLDLSNFDTRCAINMEFMFNECTSLETIYATERFVTTSVTESSYMFYNCTAPLDGGNGTIWKSSNPGDKTYAHIDGGSENPGYFRLGGAACNFAEFNGTTLVKTYKTLAEVFDATNGVTSGNRVVVLGDVTDTTVQGDSVALTNPGERSITLELNGHAITTDKIIVNNGTLAIKGDAGSIITTYDTAIVNYGTLTIGDASNPVSRIGPVIQGSNYGVVNSRRSNVFQ